MSTDKDTITLVVNAREKTVSTRDLSRNGEISFDQVLNLAFDPVPSGQYILFTVSYRNGAGRPPEGRLFSGQSVKVRDGTVFNASFTDRS